MFYKTIIAHLKTLKSNVFKKIVFVSVFIKVIGCIYHIIHASSCIRAMGLNQTHYFCSELCEYSHEME